MRWVFTARVEPPHNETISVRSSEDLSNVMFAAYSRVLRQWYHVYPGGETAIVPPAMWLCSDEYAAAHQRDNFKPDRRAPVQICRRETTVQLSLFS